MKRRLLVAAALVLVGAIAGVLAWRLRGSGDLGLGARAAGDAMGRALTLASEQAPGWWQAVHCWRPDGGGQQAPTGWTLEGGVLRGPAGHDRPLRLLLVSSARDAGADTLAAARKAAAHQVDLVLSLGGLADDEDAMVQLLEVLGHGHPVIALPGDREPVEAFARAVTRAHALDGSRLRTVETRGLVIALVPGLPEAWMAQLVPGTRGCVRAPGELSELAAWLGARPRGQDRVVLASVVPPRQRGPRATDVGAEGTHLGDPALAAIDAEVVLHGGSDGAPARAGQVVSAGALDPTGASPGAALVEVDAEGHVELTPLGN